MAFSFRLVTVDGRPADPPSIRTIVPIWRPDDRIPLGHRTLRVVDVHDDVVDEMPVLVVDDTAE
jgi:hypothetical protein